MQYLGDTISHRMKTDACRTNAAFKSVGDGIRHFAEVSDRNTFRVVDGIEQIVGSINTGFQMLASQADATERNRIQQMQRMDQQRIEDDRVRRDEMVAVHANSNSVTQSFNQAIVLVRSFNF
jgi:hypothetical protein